VDPQDFNLRILVNPVHHVNPVINKNKPLAIYSVQKKRSKILLKIILKGMNMKIKITYLMMLLLFVIPLHLKGSDFKEKKSVNKGEATFVNVQIAFLGGSIDVSGGARELLDARFEYSEMEWKPEIEYRLKNKIGNLKVSMPDAEDDISINDEDVNNWDIQLNNDIPMDLSIKLGGGEGFYDLSNLKMNSLEIKLGGGKLDIDLRNSSLPRLDFKAVAGEATLDLSGKWSNDLDADFVCGFGELNLKLPKNISVSVKASGIMGNVEAPGFSRDGSTYTNDAFRKTKVTLYIDIFGGIGNVNLDQVE